MGKFKISGFGAAVKELAGIFFVFLKIGAVAFGGGYTILPLLEKELVLKKRWITREEVLDFYTISQITPGIISVNISTFIGYKRKKTIGGVIATAAFVLPSATMALLASLCLKNFSGISAVRHCFNGIRIAVGALVLDAICKLVKMIIKKEKGIGGNIFAFCIFVLTFAASFCLKINPVLIVLAVLLCGIASAMIQKKK